MRSSERSVHIASGMYYLRCVDVREASTAAVPMNFISSMQRRTLTPVRLYYVLFFKRSFRAGLVMYYITSANPYAAAVLFTKLPHPIFPIRETPQNAHHSESLTRQLSHDLRKPISQPPDLLQPTPPRTRILPRLQTLAPHLRENTIIQRQIPHVSRETSPGDDLFHRC